MKKNRNFHKQLQPQPAPMQSIPRVLTPKILWPLWEYNPNGGIGLAKYREVDSDTFPGNGAVYQNYWIYEEASTYKDKNNPHGISLSIREFWDAFRKSVDILFADPYFAPIHYYRMITELKNLSASIGSGANKIIRIYGKNNIPALKSCETAVKKSAPQVYNTCSIEIGILPSSKSIDVHDRFAIMDGEIWHCGAAVGGMHEAVSAVSRGWPDTNDQMKNFFINKGVTVSV